VNRTGRARTVKYGGSRRENRWRRTRRRSPLVCSITIYKADIFPNKSFFSNLVHRTTDKLDVDSSWQKGRLDTFESCSHFLLYCCMDFYSAACIFMDDRAYGVAQIRAMIYIRFSITSLLRGSIIGDICNSHLSTTEFHYCECIERNITITMF